MVTLWVCTEPLIGIPPAFLEGSEEILMWLDVDYGVQVHGALATNYTRHGDLVGVPRLLEALPGAEQYCAEASEAAKQLDIDHISFVIALFDHEVSRIPKEQSPYLRLLGSFSHA